MKLACATVLFLFWLKADAQNIAADSSFLKDLAISAYLEFYAAVDDDDNNTHERPNFLYNNTRTGELALNLGFVKASWAQSKMRGNIALMTGTYADRNLASESAIFQHIYESNIGLKLNDRHNLWLDVGIMNSHIGLESAVGKDNPTLTRSLGAENTPYYETGAKLSALSRNERLSLAVLLLNGWQRINKLDGNYYPAAGLQINYKSGDRFFINYSNYFGDESPGDGYVARFFNNVFMTWKSKSFLSLYGSFDYGLQPDLNDAKRPMRNWFSWFGIVRFQLSEKWAFAARFEQYQDEYELIVQNPYDMGFLTTGLSLNFDYALSRNALFRLEARRFDAENKTFENRKGELRDVYDGLTASLSVSF